MKKILLIAAALVAAVQVQAQGTFSFNSLGLPAVYLDTVGGPLKADPNYSVTYFYSTTAGVTDQALLTVDGLGAAPKKFGGTVGAGSGTWVGGTQSLPGLGGATLTMQVRAWKTSDGATFAAAVANNGAVGYGNIFNITLGNPAGAPPTNPTALTGLVQSFAITSVPEPSTIALGVMGLSALLFRRRK